MLCYYRYTKPQTFADCVGDELPLGWEESCDQIIGRYYINHFDRKSSHLSTSHIQKHKQRRKELEKIKNHQQHMNDIEQEINAVVFLLLFINSSIYRVDTARGSPPRMEIDPRANVTGVPDIRTRCFSSQKGNLRCQKSTAAIG